MSRLFAALALGASALALAVSPAGAITGNFVEDFEHTYVGLVVFYDDNGEFSHRCSGSLLSPTVFLTAGHCTVGVSDARIYFQQDAGARFDPVLGFDPVTGYPLTGGFTGTAFTFGSPFASFPNTQDVGVVIVDRAVPRKAVGEYAVLAADGFLDAAAASEGKRGVTFTISGYGLSDIQPATLSFRERLMATTQLTNLSSALTDGFNLQTTASPGEGRGGTCFGDSGGPFLYGATDTVVAVTSFGLNANCAGTDFSYRTDQQAVIDFVRSFDPKRQIRVIGF